MEKNISLAIVGIGYWGKNILRNLYELKVLKIACDFNKEKIDMFKDQYKEVIFTTNFEEVLNDSQVKGVVISTPAPTHYDLAKRSILSGKDVFVEKPLTLKYEEGKELVELAKKHKKILMVGHILRYHPAVRKLKEIMINGQLGKIQYIYSNRLNIGKLRTEENILWSFAPHDISVILMLLEEEPISVIADGEDYLNEGIYDTTLTILEFKNKVKAHIFVSWLHPFKEQKLVVVGDKAMAVFDDLTEEKLFIYPHKIEWKEGKIPVAYKAERQVVIVENREPLKEELKHFIDCIETRKTPLTDGEEGLRVLRILELAEESIRRGTRVFLNKQNTYIHPTAIIDEDVEIEEGSKIWHFAHILKGTRIGKNCVIGQNVMIGPDVKIGDRCKIQNNVSIYKGVTLEDEVFCGPSCVFTNVYNPRAFIERKHEFKPTLVKKGATIGANATIICGVTIGKYAFVAAGAVVKEDVADYALVAGVPAEQKGWVCKCGVRLRFDTLNKATCEYCGNEYELKENKLIPLKEN